MERTFSGISFRNFRCTSRACPNIPENRNNRGRFPFDQKFRTFRVGEFPEFHSEILGVPREVGLKFRKIGITGKYCSIRHMEYPKFHSGIFLLNGKRPIVSCSIIVSRYRYNYIFTTSVLTRQVC